MFRPLPVPSRRPPPPPWALGMPCTWPHCHDNDQLGTWPDSSGSYQGRQRPCQPRRRLPAAPDEQQGLFQFALIVHRTHGEQLVRRMVPSHGGVVGSTPPNRYNRTSLISSATWTPHPPGSTPPTRYNRTSLISSATWTLSAGVNSGRPGRHSPFHWKISDNENVVWYQSTR